MPVDLNSLFQADPAAQELGLGFLGQERQMNDAKLAQQLFETQKGQAMLPAELAGKQAATRFTNAQAQEAETKNKFDISTLDQRIEGELAKVRGQMSDAHFKELNNAGMAYSQAAPLLEGMPRVVTHAAAKQILGPFYRPEFDQIPPEHLGTVVRMFGKKMMAEQMKYIQAMGVQGLKNEGAQGVANTRAGATVEAARIAAAARMRAFDKDIMEAQAAAKAKYGSYPQRASYYIAKSKEATAAIANAETPEERQALIERANALSDIANEAHQMDLAAKAAAATEGNKAKPNLNQFGIPTVTPPGQTPGAQVPQANPTVQPKNNAAASPSTQTPTGSPETYKKAFGSYEPDVYEYRMGPNGQPQRRKKQ